MGTTTRHTVAANVRAEIARSGKRQGVIARALGMGQSSLSRRLNGDVAFDVDELVALAEVLEVSLDQLVQLKSEAAVS